MDFDPTAIFSDKDLKIDKNLCFWKFSELIKILLTLSLTQKEKVSLGNISEDLMEDFNWHFSNSYPKYLEYRLLSKSQLKMLFEIEDFFEKRKNNEFIDFWQDMNNEGWKELEQKSKEILIDLKMSDLSITYKIEPIYETSLFIKRIIGEKIQTTITRK